MHVAVPWVNRTDNRGCLRFALGFRSLRKEERGEEGLGNQAPVSRIRLLCDTCRLRPRSWGGVGRGVARRVALAVHARQIVGIRMTLSTTERPAWQCEDHTVRLEPAVCRRFLITNYFAFCGTWGAYMQRSAVSQRSICRLSSKIPGHTEPLSARGGAASALVLRETCRDCGRRPLPRTVSLLRE